MGNTSKDPRQVPCIALYVDALDWADAYARAVEGWLECNRAAWQQVIDAQAEWLRPWSATFGGPMWPPFTLRGGEQLA